ncbi:transmembrane protein 19-like [Lineus longissimus]|uniref:transmembrane protein 19-like n=1 Tax=Lineus longissimus TaxID=88925 RepID=UPI00315CF7B9
MFLVCSLAVFIPISLSFWLLDILIGIYGRPEGFESEPVTPWRCLLSILIPILVAKWGLARKSLDASGAIAGLLVGFILTISNACFFASLLAFFVLGSKATKFRSKRKKGFEDDFKEGGERNWIQVLCNGGTAAQLAVIYLLDNGPSETAIDFSKKYNASWLSMAVLGALACSCGDTFSSEFGSALGKGNPRLITTLKKVPRGTNGGISFWGCLSSALGGLLVGLAYYLMMVFIMSPTVLSMSPEQWPVILVGMFAGILGSTIDSLLGATLQYSGYDKERNCISHSPGKDVEYISGAAILDNDSVNLIAALLTALFTPKIAFHVWWYFT